MSVRSLDVAPAMITLSGSERRVQTTEESEGTEGPDAATLVRGAGPTIAALCGAAAHCHACPLWRRGTQTGWGEGAAHARIMLVGEQPGDQEDQQGHPFVGPAGKLLWAALAEAGIERRSVYITNAVKHFKWLPQGKKRIHQKPNRREIEACRPWLLAEIAVVKPH